MLSVLEKARPPQNKTAQRSLSRTHPRWCSSSISPACFYVRLARLPCMRLERKRALHASCRTRHRHLPALYTQQPSGRHAHAYVYVQGSVWQHMRGPTLGTIHSAVLFPTPQAYKKNPTRGIGGVIWYNSMSRQVPYTTYLLQLAWVWRVGAACGCGAWGERGCGAWV